MIPFRFGKIKNYSFTFLGFLQALGIFLYCSLVGLLIWVANTWFGPVQTFLGPLLFLSLLVASVLICALLAFGYPIILFWDHKDTKNAVRLVSYTAGWLVVFVVFVLVALAKF